MKKQTLATLLVYLLLALQSSLQADSDKQFLNGKPFSFLDGEFVSQQELESVNKAIEETNAKIGDLEERLSKLEDSEPPDPSQLTFTGDFKQDEPPGANILQDWSNFTTSATGSFNSIEIRNSFDGGASTFARATCSEPEKASALASALNTLDPKSPAITTLECENLIWNIEFCSYGKVELSAGISGASACNCFYRGLAIRPTVKTRDWGGAGPDFVGSRGGTCGATDQTLEVVLTR
jgi:hypothetical protein